MITQGESYRHSTTIGILTDNILLDIFDFYRNDHNYTHCTVWKWHLLVHVCRSWRQIIFESPHRLDLQIPCTYKTPVKKCLGIWPNLLSKDGNTPPLPPEFLGRSAPCLQIICLCNIAFPTLPTLLLSASDLVELKLSGVPPAGYFSPEAVVTSLAALPRLGTFYIVFHSTTPRADRMPLPPITRTVLPALTHFEFTGANEYLEDLLSRIDGPRLSSIVITYLIQVMNFQVVQFFKFFDRLVGPEITLFRDATVRFNTPSPSVTVHTYRPTTQLGWDWHVTRTIISYQEFEWHPSHLAQMLGQFSAILSTVVHLKAKFQTDYPLSDADDLEWLRLLHQFSTVQALYLSQQFSGRIARALKSIPGETVAEALSSLDFICLEDQPSSSIEKFVAVRQLSGRPVIVVGTEAEFDQRLESYIRK